MRCRGGRRFWIVMLMGWTLGSDLSGAGAQAISSQPGSTAPQALSLEEALRRAEANEPAFAAAAAEKQATALERRDARAALLPSATYHNQYLFTQSNQTQATTTQGGVSQSLPVFIANNAVHEYASQAVINETAGLAQVGAVRLADANAARAAAELEVARRGLVATVVGLYYGLSSAAGKVSIARRALAEANHFVEITSERESAREAAHADVIKAQLQQQGRERDLREAMLLAERARAELGVLLFPDPATSYTVVVPDLPPPLPDRAGVEAAARARNPELRSALALLQVSAAETYSAQAALLPELGLNFTYGIDAPQAARRGPDGARNLGYSASVTLDLPLWDWFTTERKIKESRLRSEASKVALTAAQRRLVASLDEFYAEADVAREQLASLQASVSTARESLRLTNLRYVDGEGTVLDVVDAQNTLLSAENAQTDGAVRYQVALAQLQTLTGKL